MKLDRPLAFFDIESTGTSPGADRIVELAVVRLMPDGSRESRTWRLNPGIPIPAEVTAIHGITDADVADCPSFADAADDILKAFDDADLSGYNVLRFDIPMLTEEFFRAGIRFEWEHRRIIDVQRIYHRKEPRDLTAALAFYCNEMHLDAHGAVADVDATIRVLEAQCGRYTDLPSDMDGLDAYCNPRQPGWVDRTGRLKWQNGEVVLNFGKRKGTPLRQIVEGDTNFVNWMLRSDFPRDVKEILMDAMQGKWPVPPKEEAGNDKSDDAAG